MMSRVDRYLRTLPVYGVALAALSIGAPAAVAAQTTSWIQIAEPVEWRGESPRAVPAEARRTVRISGTARLDGGVSQVIINGLRAALQSSNDGTARFTAYVRADSAIRDVDVVVSGPMSRPLMKRYAVQVLPATRGLNAASAWQSSGRTRGTRWAVVVGVSKYRDKRIVPLSYAAADAQAMYDFLVSERAGLGGFKQENVRLLLDSAATYRNLRTALSTFLRGATENDFVLIYFAGHGAPDPDRPEDLFLLNHDAEADNVAGSAFPMSDVSKAVKEIYARDVIVITDACHSAGVGGQVGRREMGLNQINRLFLEQMGSSSGGYLSFTASQATQTSQEGPQWGGGHGVFTHFLLEGLRGAADDDTDRIVTLGELTEWVRDRVRRETRNAQIPTISQTAFDNAWPMSLVPEAPARRVTSAADVNRIAAQTAVERGRILSEMNRWDEARPFLEEAVRLNPDAPDGHAYLARVLLNRDEDAAAAREALEAVRLAPQWAFPRRQLGHVMRNLDSLTAARDQYLQALRLNPLDDTSHASLGLTLLGLDQKNDALRAAREAVRLNPAYSTTHSTLARVLAGMGQLRGAIASYRDAIRVSSMLSATYDGAVSSFYAEITRLRVQAGDDTTAALQDAREAVRLFPRSARAYAELGGVLATFQRTAEAEQALREAIRIDPKVSIARAHLGWMLNNVKRYEEAIQELRVYLALRPNYAWTHGELGRAYEGLTQNTAAIAAYREAVRIDPKNAYAQARLGALTKP